MNKVMMAALSAADGWSGTKTVMSLMRLRHGHDNDENSDMAHTFCF